MLHYSCHCLEEIPACLVLPHFTFVHFLLYPLNRLTGKCPDVLFWILHAFVVLKSNFAEWVGGLNQEVIVKAKLCCDVDSRDF